MYVPGPVTVYTEQDARRVAVILRRIERFEQARNPAGTKEESTVRKIPTHKLCALALASIPRPIPGAVWPEGSRAQWPVRPAEEMGSPRIY